MKFGQFIEYNKRNILLQNHGANESEKLVPDRFLFFKKLYIRYNKMVCTA